MIHLWLVACLWLGIGLLPPTGPSPAQDLAELVNRAGDDEDLEDLVPLQRAALEAGPKALPVLKPLLASRSKSRRWRAAFALAFTAQPEAIDLLIQVSSRPDNQQLKSLVCFALAGRGTSKDINFLVRSLQGEHYGDEWQPIQIAALSLGVLRAKGALAPLEACARDTPESIASGAAEVAISWIRAGSFGVQSTVAAPDRELIIAVVSNGIPRLSESSVFREPQAKRIWEQQDRTWTVKAWSGDQDALPSISFEPFVSSDDRRAVVSVGLHFGRLNGVGYDYLLSRRDGSWRVIGILPTWIS